MAKYPSPADGEWVQPVKKGYRMACCDCGLVHTMNFRIFKGRVQFQAMSNARSTGQMRRQFESIRIIKQSKKLLKDLKTRKWDKSEWVKLTDIDINKQPGVEK